MRMTYEVQPTTFPSHLTVVLVPSVLFEVVYVGEVCNTFIYELKICLLPLCIIGLCYLILHKIYIHSNKKNDQHIFSNDLLLFKNNYNLL